MKVVRKRIGEIEKLSNHFFQFLPSGITHESQVWRQRDNPLLIDRDLNVPVPPYLPRTEITLNDIRQVYSNIVAMDKQVGVILNELEEDGLLESTIVFFYSDHGGPLPRQKRLLYDSGIQVPLIIRYPGKWRAGEIDDQLISFVDFKSTTLSLAGIQPPSYVDGRAFVGEFASASPRTYIHAAADRFDNEYDTIRAVRDARFKYLRNYNLDKAYYLPLPYREQMPIMQELLRLNEQGKLTKNQAQWFRSQKPLEELFDIENDPYELENLSADPKYSEKLQELRKEMDSWLSEFNDLGLMPEDQLVKEFWPEGIQPTTKAPTIFKENGEVQIHSGTPGANIAFQVVSQQGVLEDRWQIYTEPFKLDSANRLVAFAHRIGYLPSTQVEYIQD